jgi:hypothetical protein
MRFARDGDFREDAVEVLMIARAARVAISLRVTQQETPPESSRP